MTLKTMCLALGAATLIAGCQLPADGSQPGAAPRQAPPQKQADPAAAPMETVAVERAAPRLSGSVAATGFGKLVATAVRAHPDVRTASYAIDVAEAEMDAVSNSFIPAVSVGATAANELVGRDTKFYTTPYLRVSQLVYDGGISDSRQTAALAAVQAATNDRLVTASEVAYAAIEAYASLRSAREVLALMQENLATHEEIGEQIEERSSVGAGGRSDLLTVRSRIADARTKVIEAQTSLARAQAECISSFGMTPMGDITVPQPPRLVSTSPDSIGNAPRMLALNSNLLVSEAQLQVAQSELMPQIELGSTAKRNVYGDAGVTFDLTVNYAFDTRGQSKAVVQKQLADVNRIKAQKSALVREIRRSLDYARAEQTSGAARLQAAQAAVDANRDNVDAAREEFQIGRRDLLSLLDAQADFIDAKQNVISARTDMTLAGYEALSLTGDIVEAVGATLGDLTSIVK